MTGEGGQHNLNSILERLKKLKELGREEEEAVKKGNPVKIRDTGDVWGVTSPAGSSIEHQNSEVEKGSNDRKPWWVDHPPKVIQMNSLRSYRNGNHVYVSVRKIKDDQENEAEVFIKVFDPEGRIADKSRAEMHAVWAQDAYHQQRMRQDYQKRYGSQVPILYSASSREENGFPVIIQEVAPKEYVGDLLKDKTINLSQRREIFLKALTQYTQYGLVSLDYARELMGKGEGFYKFGDQKFSDLRWDSANKSLIVLDVQRNGGNDQSAEFVETAEYFGMSEFKTILNSTAELLTPQEQKLISAVQSKTSVDRSTELMLFLYHDFALGQLTIDDPRLGLTEKEQIEAKMKKWSVNCHFAINLALDYYSSGGFTDGIKVIEKYLSRLEPGLQENAKILKALLEIERLDSENSRRLSYEEISKGSSERQKTRKQTTYGFLKYISGDWDSEDYPDEKTYKKTFISQLKRIKDSAGSSDEIKRIIESRFTSVIF